MSTPRLSTMIHLVEELQKLPSTPGIEFMIAEAKAGEYHDYKNKKYACGKVAVYALLKKEGLTELAARIVNGDFDEEADAEDIKYLKTICPPGMEKIMGLEEEVTH